MSKNPEVFIPIDPTGWKEGSIQIPPNGEIAVYAMTYNDHILIKNPDGLMNGSALATVIQRRIPAVKNPWEIPEHHINRLVAALHLATNGNEASLTFRCPHCNEFNDMIVNASHLINEEVTPDYSPITHNNLHIEFNPLVYRDVVTQRNQQYRLSKVMQAIVPTAKINSISLQQEIHNHLNAAAKTNAMRIKQISVGNVIVGNKQQIAEFLTNASYEVSQLLDKKFANINETLMPKATKTQCISCYKESSISVSLDPSEEFKSKIQNLTDEEMIELFKKYENQINDIRKEAAKLSWFMRGGASFEDILEMTNAERSALSMIINENLETTKKSGMPFF